MAVATPVKKMRWLLVMVLLCAGIGQASAEANPRYAAIVLDADSGEVLHAAHADAPRYPASLTKMMTLYLLFDAMDKGLMRLDTAMPVSAHAASMPQTNISLKKGDRLRVRDAIPALVVRSANDAAVVVAEALGGTESEFARMMTAKAKEMKMTSTTFRNASGLPNAQQRTTARDLSILSMRLMQDHADYYHYFSTASFTYGGKTYNSHNRMIKNYPGTDGMKTGYINASGFNVATSTLRGDHRLIGVVMGGRSAQSRDAEMVALLDKSFIRAEQLAKLSPKAAKRSPAAPPSKVVVSTQTVRQVTRQATNTQVKTQPPVVVKTLPRPLVGASQPQAVSSGRLSADLGWAVQVGSFRASEQARDRASDAARRLDDIEFAQVAVNEVSISDRTLFRAQLIGLQQEQAKRACERLVLQGMDCLVIKMPNS